MIETPLKDSLESSTQPLGTWLSIGHPTVAEATARLDLDFVLIDTEHTTMSLETVEGMHRGVEAAPGTVQTVVRVPWNDSVTLKRVLDIGVAGVMVPMIDTAGEARDFVAAVRYPPDGHRGVASGRATGYGQNFEAYVNEANANVLTIVQIETGEGLENAREIAEVDGVDALFVGPADLSRSLDLFGEWESEEFERALREIVEAGKTTGTPVGTLTVDPADIATRLDQGFDYLIAGKDTSVLMDGVADAIATYRAARTSDQTQQ